MNLEVMYLCCAIPMKHLAVEHDTYTREFIEVYIMDKKGMMYSLSYINGMSRPCKFYKWIT